MFFFLFCILCSQHLLSQWMCIRGDYRCAMAHEKEALSAFTSLVRMREMSGLVCACVHVSNCFFFSIFLQLGENHSQTQCSKEFLLTITKQAVKVERSLRQAGADCTEQAVEVLQAK